MSRFYLSAFIRVLTDHSLHALPFSLNAEFVIHFLFEICLVLNWIAFFALYQIMAAVLTQTNAHLKIKAMKSGDEFMRDNIFSFHCLWVIQMIDMRLQIDCGESENPLISLTFIKIYTAIIFQAITLTDHTFFKDFKTNILIFFITLDWTGGCWWNSHSIGRWTGRISSHIPKHRSLRRWKSYTDKHQVKPTINLEMIRTARFRHTWNRKHFSERDKLLGTDSN